MKRGAVVVSAPMRRAMTLAERLARTPCSTALITGESGVGKEIVAAHIHATSCRASGPFIQVNTAAIPEAVLEAELFGSVRGAYTDAQKDRLGMFAMANGGTLLLDEIGELRIDLQPKLLRALEERRFYPVGADRERSVDLRVVASTNRDLRGAIAAGRFRRDLYFRLSVVTIHVPPLRDRREDILPLAEHFAAVYAAQLQVAVPTLDAEGRRRLLAHEWPGNVRELRNVIERGVIEADGGTALLVDLFDEPTYDSSDDSLSELAMGTPLPAPRPSPQRLDATCRSALEQAERPRIVQALEAVGGRVTEAARLLGIARSTLWAKMRRYGITAADVRSRAS